MRSLPTTTNAPSRLPTTFASREDAVAVRETAHLGRATVACPASAAEPSHAGHAQQNEHDDLGDASFHAPGRHDRVGRCRTQTTAQCQSGAVAPATCRGGHRGRGALRSSLLPCGGLLLHRPQLSAKHLASWTVADHAALDETVRCGECRIGCAVSNQTRSSVDHQDLAARSSRSVATSSSPAADRGVKGQHPSTNRARRKTSRSAARRGASSR